jgi:hypothetical protein
MKKITAIGIKEKDKPFRVTFKEVFKLAIDSLPPGKWKLTVEKYYKKASPLQFGWLYGSIYPLSLIALNDAGYEFTNIDQVDIFWKCMFANKEVLNRETGEIMKIPLSKSEFVTVDQMLYCNSIRDHCAEYLGTSIPEPDVNWKQIKEDQNKP